MVNQSAADHITECEKKKKKETDMKDPDACKTKVKGYCNLFSILDRWTW